MQKEMTSEEQERWRAQQMLANNPDNRPVGDFTGRCRACGSTDLWSDNLTYGCDNCKAIFLRN